MIIKELKITNSSGESIEFGRHFRLYEEIDLSGLKADVSYSESSNDGASYQKTRLSTADFSVPFFINRTVEGPEWIEEKRQEAYRVFNPKKNPMRLDFTTKGGKSYYINAELIAAPTFSTGFENSNYRWQKGLLQFTCSDPYLYEKDSTMIEIATWVGNFEFPLEIPEEGIEMGYRSKSLIANVYNDGQEDSGMVIRFKATGTVVNPTLLNVNTYEEFKFKEGFTMQGVDVVEVSTYRGKKSVSLKRNNVVSKIFSQAHLETDWLQLSVGDNLFRYDAADGLDKLEVSMYFTKKYLGV